MNLWKRASGALKDQKSLLKASLTYRSALRNPNIEKSVIRATTHDESRVDYRSAQCIFAWVRISDDCLYRLLWTLFGRMKRTHNWVVALKGIMLLHGVFCCKVLGIQDIGQLPYDVLNLKDKSTNIGKMWGLNAFIHAYYAFLDEKSRFIFLHSQEQRKRNAVLSLDGMKEEQKENSMIHDFIWLQHLQGLLNTLLKTQPKSRQMVNVLVLEAMDCIVIEIYDIYSRISNGIRNVLARITFAGKNEAKIALSILQKAKVQHDKLSDFLEFCKDIGVGNASECPKMEDIPEEVFRELEQILNGDPEQLKTDQSPTIEMKLIIVEQHKVMKIYDHNNSMSSLKTVVVTDDWEVFDEEQNKSTNLLDPFTHPAKKNTTKVDPLPDLISL